MTKHTVPMSPLVASREEGDRIYQDMFQRMALSWAATFGQEPAREGALPDILRTTAYAIADEARRMIDVRVVINLGNSVNLPDANHAYLRDWKDTESFLARRDDALSAIARAPTLYFDGKVPVLTDDVWVGKRYFSVKDRSTKLNSERVTIRVSLGRDFEAGQLDEVLAELVSDGWTISEGGES